MSINKYLGYSANRAKILGIAQKLDALRKAVEHFVGHTKEFTPRSTEETVISFLEKKIQDSTKTATPVSDYVKRYKQQPTYQHVKWAAESLDSKLLMHGFLPSHSNHGSNSSVTQIARYTAAEFRKLLMTESQRIEVNNREHILFGSETLLLLQRISEKNHDLPLSDYYKAARHARLLRKTLLTLHKESENRQPTYLKEIVKSCLILEEACLLKANKSNEITDEHLRVAHEHFLAVEIAASSKDIQEIRAIYGGEHKKDSKDLPYHLEKALDELNKDQDDWSLLSNTILLESFAHIAKDLRSLSKRKKEPAQLDTLAIIERALSDSRAAGTFTTYLKNRYPETYNLLPEIAAYLSNNQRLCSQNIKSCGYDYGSYDINVRVLPPEKFIRVALGCLRSGNFLDAAGDQLLRSGLTGERMLAQPLGLYQEYKKNPKLWPTATFLLGTRNALSDNLTTPQVTAVWFRHGQKPRDPKLSLVTINNDHHLFPALDTSSRTVALWGDECTKNIAEALHICSKKPAVRGEASILKALVDKALLEALESDLGLPEIDILYHMLIAGQHALYLDELAR